MLTLQSVLQVILGHTYMTEHTAQGAAHRVVIKRKGDEFVDTVF